MNIYFKGKRDHSRLCEQKRGGSVRLLHLPEGQDEGMPADLRRGLLQWSSKSHIITNIYVNRSYCVFYLAYSS